MVPRPCVHGEASVALGSLDVRAVVGNELPSAGLVDPCVAANHRASTVRAVESGIVGELIVCDRGIGSEGRHLYIADLAFGELDGLVLRLLDGLGLGRPVAPAVPLDIAVSQVLLIPRDIAIHLRVVHVFFELLDLGGRVAATLRDHCDGYRQAAHCHERIRDFPIHRCRSIFV